MIDVEQIDHAAQPPGGSEALDLRWSMTRSRSLVSALLTLVVTSLTLLALVPLFSVLIMLIWRGGNQLRLSLFTELPPTAFEEGGGFGNAILGTFAVVLIASLLSVPFGILAAIFLSEAEPDNRLARATRFSAKLLTGFPSILAGVFAYGAIVIGARAIGLGGFSAIAGGVALSILMLPMVMLTAEESLRLVPRRMREASFGMGATRTQTLTRVMLPTALPGILTGIMLSVARAAGETAPLLFTALFSNYWLMTDGTIDLMQPTASLAVLIYNFSSMPFENQIEMAWAAAFVLVMLVLVTNLIGQALSSRSVHS